MADNDMPPDPSQEPEDFPSENGDPNELELLSKAIQRFANHMAEGPVIVNNSLLVWEVSSFDDEGRHLKAIRYAVPNDGLSLSASLGLIEASGEFVRRDILGLRTEY